MCSSSEGEDPGALFSGHPWVRGKEGRICLWALRHVRLGLIVGGHHLSSCGLSPAVILTTRFLDLMPSIAVPVLSK
ncbi:hypothetical protein PVAP13_8KG260600 [Panicum virgatum]|uniref:Uncharacterized protein n=1 Tax=Panicum virgatum TaxID=38727 RepID=A0A8T0PK99_PANVG|nr:hypothetical protein PVAP13_8KG260600 [Panicum virgatum]KAG2562373.1 hypothetical protein PVAP13_8KG260600 [Panicum virgatum]